MFIFGNKKRKELVKLYKELEASYRQLDRQKEELHKYREDPTKSIELRHSIQWTEKCIHETKNKIIELEES